MSIIAGAIGAPAARPSVSPVARFAAVVRHAFDWLYNRAALLRSRQSLADLDDRMLRDIGVDRLTARQEANRGVWL